MPLAQAREIFKRDFADVIQKGRSIKTTTDTRPGTADSNLGGRLVASQGTFTPRGPLGSIESLRATASKAAPFVTRPRRRSASAADAATIIRSVMVLVRLRAGSGDWEKRVATLADMTPTVTARRVVGRMFDRSIPLEKNDIQAPGAFPTLLRTRQVAPTDYPESGTKYRWRCIYERSQPGSADFQVREVVRPSGPPGSADL